MPQCLEVQLNFDILQASVCTSAYFNYPIGKKEEEMSEILKAWGQVGTGPFLKWEVDRRGLFIHFRQSILPRLIGIPVKNPKMLQIDTVKVFESLCPPEIIGKPIVRLHDLTLGFEGNGTEVLLSWLES
jgi:hypothetical protein